MLPYIKGNIGQELVLILVHGSSVLGLFLNVLRERLVRLLKHQRLLLTRVALFPSGLALLRLRAAEALPKEDNSLANKHTDSTGSQTSHDAQNGRNKNEVDDAREGVSKSTLRMHGVVLTMVFAILIAIVAVMTQGSHHLLVLATALAACLGSHAQHALLRGGQKSTDAGSQQLL